MSPCTGLVIVMTPELQSAQAFVVKKVGKKSKGKNNFWAYAELCEDLQPKLDDQVKRLARLSSEYNCVVGTGYRCELRQ